MTMASEKKESWFMRHPGAAIVLLFGAAVAAGIVNHYLHTWLLAIPLAVAGFLGGWLIGRLQRKARQEERKAKARRDEERRLFAELDARRQACLARSEELMGKLHEQFVRQHDVLFGPPRKPSKAERPN